MDVRPLRPDELDAADRLVRVAFGTFLGLPDPAAMFGDADPVRTRYRQAPDNTLAAVDGGELVGLVQMAQWGSASFLGPLATSPAVWDRGVGRALMGAAVERFDAWGASLGALFTFPSSPKHVTLYHRFGFSLQNLVPIMTKSVTAPHAPLTPTLLSHNPRERGRLAEVTDALFAGLDVDAEVATVLDQGVGDVVMLESGRGFAVCHLGAGETTSATCYVKFAAVAPGPRSSTDFGELLDGVEALAAARELGVVETGVDAGRHAAYQALLDAGYRTQFLGVHMARPDAVGWSGPASYVLDDLR